MSNTGMLWVWLRVSASANTEEKQWMIPDINLRPYTQVHTQVHVQPHSYANIRMLVCKHTTWKMKIIDLMMVSAGRVSSLDSAY